MASPALFVCSRCLQALKRNPRSSSAVLHSTNPRSYYHATAASILHNPRGPARPLRLVPNSIRFLTTTTPSSPNPIPSPPPRATRPPTDLSTSAPSHRTIAILNPRSDPETGEKWHVDVTPRAARRLQQIMTKEQTPSLCLRVSVESGGCHGFQYLMSLGDISSVSPEEDTLFVVEEGRGQDVVGQSDWAEVGEGKAKVVMDEASLELLQGSKIDYTMELIGSQFKIVDNPRATSSCGCGTSFDVKA